MTKFIIGAAICTIIGLIIMQFIDPNLGNKIEGDNPTHQTDDPNTINVSIVGEILRADKTFTMPSDSNLNDLITAAGGLTENADTKAFYPEIELTNNQTYYIAPLYHISGGCADTPIKKININTATKEEMLEFSSTIFKDAMTTAIVNYRDTAGNRFNCIEDIKLVSGIGEATYLKVRDYIILHD